MTWLTILMQYTVFLLCHASVVTVRLGKRDFNEGGGVYLCVCSCALCLDVNKLPSHNSALV